MASKELSPIQPSDERNQSLRLTFSYKGSDVKLVKRERVRMIPLPSDPIYYQKNQTGFWYELQDDDGRTLYRRIINNPIQFYEEIFLGNEKRSSNEERSSITRQRIDNPQGIFILLPPYIQGARHIVLFSSPSEQEFTSKPAEEIGRFNLELESKRRVRKNN
jgi:hypothetical protein